MFPNSPSDHPQTGGTSVWSSQHTGELTMDFKERADEYRRQTEVADMYRQSGFDMIEAFRLVRENHRSK